MPKYGVHQIVLDKVSKKLASEFDHEAAHIISDNREHAMLGAIGPDLFFWAPDYEKCDTIITIYTTIHKLAKMVDPILNPVKTAAEAVGDQMGFLMSELDQDDTRALIDKAIESLKETKKEIENTIITITIKNVFIQ